MNDPWYKGRGNTVVRDTLDNTTEIPENIESFLLIF
jgi:hypothetical protein